jgi:ferredoxin-NADP reductase
VDLDTKAPATTTDQPGLTEKIRKKSFVVDPGAILRGEEEIDRIKLELISKKPISHDTFIGTFGFDPEKTLGVPVGYHLRIFAKNAEGAETKHTYTPISLVTTKGHVEILIKVYRPCEEFPKGGELTQIIDNVKVGESITVGGPRGLFSYLGRGNMFFKADGGFERHFKKITFLAGGTGITPFAFMIRHIVLDAEEQTEVTLVFSNKTMDDMLLHDEFLQYQRDGKLKYVWTVTREEPADGSDTKKGRINLTMIQNSIPAPEEDHLVMYCGPKGFNVTSKNILELLNHQEKNILKC